MKTSPGKLPDGPVWSPPPRNLQLTESKIHVWRADLRVSATIFSTLKETLSSDEVARARRFRFRRDHDRFITARGISRTLLGIYLNIEPDCIRFGYGRRGKPFVEGSSADKRISFNISHSGDLALFGFSRDREIGVDVERIRDDISDEEISERFFSAGECAVLRSKPPHLRTQEFFRFWTCKEAFIKAIGEGMHLQLNRFEVVIVDAEKPHFVRTMEESATDSRWYVGELALGPEYAGTVVSQGRAWECVCWDWTEDYLGSLEGDG